MENDERSISEDTSRFLQLIAMFQVAAMQQLGKYPNPVTNEIECDLEQAKASIDMLETIEKKTRGNLVEVETQFMDKVLFELRMNYVDEVNRAQKEKQTDKKTKKENEDDVEAPSEHEDKPTDLSDEGRDASSEKEEE